MQTWQLALALYCQIIILFVALAVFYTDPSADESVNQPVTASTAENPSRKPLPPIPDFWNMSPEQCPEESKEPYKLMPREPEHKQTGLTRLV